MILTRTRLSNIIDIAYMFFIGIIIILFIGLYINQQEEEEREIKQFIERQNVTAGIIEQNKLIICLEEEILKQLDRTNYRFATSSEVITSCYS